MKNRSNHFLRYMGIVGVFCLICVIYLGRLFYIQISGRENSYSAGTTTRTVTIQAVRGEIFDCNGNPLVSNRYTYDLTLSYSALSLSGVRQANETCLSLLEALARSGESDKHVEKFFPFDGAYPYYLLSEEAGDGESTLYYRWRRVLKAIGLNEDAGPSQVVKYYVSTYDLLATDANGKRLFTDSEIDSLIRLRYDMDAVGFKSAGEYTLAEEIGMVLMTDVKEQNLAGASFEVNVARVYNYPGYASHILGTVGPIYSEEWEYYNEQGYQMNAIVGKSGCEMAFESYLHGSDGLLLIEEDASGNVLRLEVQKEPIAGSDVHLTIDIDLQIAAEEGLAENVDYVVSHANGAVEYGADCQAGAAVVLDPDTFAVLAIASYPSYDLTTYNTLYNQLLSDEAQPLFNRALNGLYAPGSTYKLGVSVAALMEGVITADSGVVCTGKYTRYDSYQPACSTYEHPYGTTSLTAVQAIADSCNVFFYEMGYRLGIDRMNHYMSAFGFGESTGLELGGKPGVLAGPDYRQEIHGALWTDGLTLQAAIGQSDNLASPLQLACYLGTLTGGGTRYSAHLLDSVYTFGSDTPYYAYTQTEDSVLSRLEIPESVLDTVLEGMRKMVDESYTVSRFITDEIPVEVGGKTGTAQNSSGCDNALFVAAAPYDDPDLVISVVIEQGYSGGYASLTAARILEAYYARTE